MDKSCINTLIKAGINYEHAIQLRRISMTLHRWHELECGDSNEYHSWTITRGRKSKGSFEYDDDGKPFLEDHAHLANNVRYYPVPDRERGALKRLAKIMANYPTMRAYVQGDPRGASLYILRNGDVPEGAGDDSYYSRGIAVYK